MIPDSFIAELKSRIEVEDVIGSYVKLRRQGSNLVGLCPFHGEKTPSFTVFTGDQHYYCFGCGAGGDAITFIRAIENLEYVDAIHHLAERAGLKVPDTGTDEEGQKLRQRVLEAMKEAARFFHSHVTDKVAQDYIKERGIAPNIATRYGIGYAPDSWSSLLTHMKSKGFDEPLLRRAGLCSVGQKGNYFDTFRGRLIFPIIDTRGQVIAFGGRAMGDVMPKYLNSPDTPVFKKSRTLFSLNLAKNAKKDRFILAEGYMDVVAMNQAGFTETVATLGTALTADQARLISRYVKEAVIAYDMDEAGRKATERAITILTEAGLKVRVLNYEGAKDPDEYIKKFGINGLKRKLDASSTSIEYRIERAAFGKDLADPDIRVEYLSEVANILATVDSAISVDVYAGRVSSETGIDKQSLMDEVKRRASARYKKENAKELSEERRRLVSGPVRNTHRAANLKVSRAEEGLICLLFHNPSFAAELEGKLNADDFSSEFNRSVYITVTDSINLGKTPDISDFSSLDMSEIGTVSGMISLKDTLSGTKEQLLEFASTIKNAKIKQNLKKDNSEDLKSYIEHLGKSKATNVGDENE